MTGMGYRTQGSDRGHARSEKMLSRDHGEAPPELTRGQPLQGGGGGLKTLKSPARL